MMDQPIIDIQAGFTLVDLLEGIKIDNYPLSRTRDEKSPTPRLPDATRYFMDVIIELYPTANVLTIASLRQIVDGISVLSIRDENGNQYMLRVAERRATEIERELLITKLPSGITPSFDVAFSGFLGGLSILVGRDSARMPWSLGEYYMTHSATEIIRVLDAYFRSMVGTWYEERRFEKDIDLPKLYKQQFGLDEKRLHRSLKNGLPEFEGMTNLPVLYSDRKCVNPVYVFSALQGRYDTFVATTLGNYWNYDLIVSHNDEPQITSFSHIEASHILRDIVLLETFIKALYLDATVPLALRISLEVELMSGEDRRKFDASMESSDIAKCVTVIYFLRDIARSMTFPFSRFDEYLNSLLFANLLVFASSHNDYTARAHCLITAGLIYEKLRENG